jgi:hypothetical protein
MSDSRSFYTSNSLKLMSRIEDVVGGQRMFHEVYPDLQRQWEAAVSLAESDQDQTKPLMRFYNELCKLHDNLTMD